MCEVMHDKVPYCGTKGVILNQLFSDVCDSIYDQSGGINVFFVDDNELKVLFARIKRRALRAVSYLLFISCKFVKGFMAITF